QQRTFECGHLRLEFRRALLSAIMRPRRNVAFGALESRNRADPAPAFRELAPGLQSLEKVASNGAIPVAMADFLLAFVRAQARLQQEGIARAGQSHLGLDTDLPGIPRHCLGPLQLVDCAERIVLLDV